MVGELGGDAREEEERYARGDHLQGWAHGGGGGLRRGGGLLGLLGDDGFDATDEDGERGKEGEDAGEDVADDRLLAEGKKGLEDNLTIRQYGFAPAGWGEEERRWFHGH